MLCPLCNKVQADVELKLYSDGKTFVYKVCEDCYRLASSVDQRELVFYLRELYDRTCPVCGMTYRKFSETLLLGCPHCYKAFEKQLEPFIGSVQHK